jgi:hypothetical protein
MKQWGIKQEGGIILEYDIWRIKQKKPLPGYAGNGLNG